VPVLESAGSDRVAELRSFLAKDPIQNLYLLGVLEEHGISGRVGATPMRFLLLREAGQVVAAAFSGGSLLVPCVYEAPMAGALAKALKGQVPFKGSMGDRTSVDALFWALNDGAAVRISRPQRLFVATADALGPFVESQLRLAIPPELDKVLSLAANCVRDNMGRDPLAEGSTEFRARVEQRIASSRTYVLRTGGAIVFKVDVGVRSQYGAELEGVYTVAPHRKKGIATRCLGQLARSLLSALPRLTIRIDEGDVALSSACRKVGFHATRPQRLLLLD
jgi:hypothetical protein